MLFAWSGTPGTSFGAHVWKGGKAVLNQHIFKVEFNETHLDKRYFRYAINQKLQYLIDLAHGGVGLRHVTKGKFENTEIPLPPLDEQHRIVAKLDSLFERTRRAREELSHIPRLIENYKKAILEEAFRGDLTRDWRDAHDVLVESWGNRTLDTLLTGIRAGRNLRCEERPPREHERGVVKVSAVTWGTFDKGQAKTLPTVFNPSPDTLIRSGDFLFSRANTIDLVGSCVIVEDAPDNLYLSDKVLRLDMPNAAKPWVLWFLRCRQGRELLENASTGNQLSMRNVSQSALRAIACPWPTEPERHEILRRIESSTEAIERIKFEQSVGAKLLDHLDQANLAKAFRGELVPQDPNDEPASVLLERICAARAKQPKDTRKGRGKTANAKVAA
ncbi:restriction endonuclease subunit S [Thiocapsa rosea]|uniref:restriction endonuclease subunit S n=1 Tax=Thiocapsa rosea TaxID=69360 RepID=UPI001FE7A4FF